MRNLATTILLGFAALAILGMVTLTAPQMRREALKAVQTKGVAIREIHGQAFGCSKNRWSYGFTGRLDGQHIAGKVCVGWPMDPAVQTWPIR